MDRRHFLQSSTGITGVASYFTSSGAQAAGATAEHPALAEAIAGLPKTYLTPQGEFHNVERGNPLPYKLPAAKRREVGLERETWKLELLADPEDEAKTGRACRLDKTMTRAGGNAFSFADLMDLAKTRAVRFLKVVSCNNISDPLGIAVWEGVPLRDVIWLAGPRENYRSVYYDGYHNDDPKQLFQCWLPANRVLEDPPGFLPVILCYKINGEWLTGERGGPVRMIVPEAYGFKSVKWIQRVVITNKYQPEDTYALQNNEVNDSWLKSRALFEEVPGKVAAGAEFAITGQAQVGIGGLAKVQWRVDPDGDGAVDGDQWHDAQLLPLPEDWHGGAEFGPLHPSQFDPATGKPRQWPMPYTLCRWIALIPGLKAGAYDLRCRAIDLAGNAQPMPRPYKKSGRSAIVRKAIVVEA